MATKCWNSQGLGIKSEVVTPSDAGANEFDLLYIGNTESMMEQREQKL